MGGYRGRGKPTRVISRKVVVRAPDGLEVDPCVDALRTLASVLNHMAAHIARWDMGEGKKGQSLAAEEWAGRHGYGRQSKVGTPVVGKPGVAQGGLPPKVGQGGH